MLSKKQYQKVLKGLHQDLLIGDATALQTFTEKEINSVIRDNRILGLYYRLINNKTNYPLLNKRAKQGQIRAFRQTQLLLEIHEYFQKANIPYINLKGPVLSQQIYGDYTIRQSRDLDVLIRIEDLKRSIEVLNSLGFDLQYKLSKIRRFTDKEIKFLHKEDGSLLELHTRLFNNPHLLPIDKLDFSEAEYININDNALPVLPEAINFLYLLMHALAHNFSRFIWLWDVYFFKIQMNTKHWQEAELLSKSLGLNQWFNQAEKMNGDNLLRWQTQEHYQGIKRAQYLLTLSSQFKYRFHEILLILLSPYRRWRKK